MGKDHYDAILASAPLNSTAGRVTSRGFQYEPNTKPGHQQEWDAPPPFVHFRASGPEQRNLVGVSFGRLVVVGYLGEGKWCCRCACGRYVARKQKSVLNPANAEIDRCHICRHTAFLRREAGADRTHYRKANGVFGKPVYKDGREA